MSVPGPNVELGPVSEPMLTVSSPGCAWHGADLVSERQLLASLAGLTLCMSWSEMLMRACVIALTDQNGE